VPYFALCLFAGIRPGVPNGEITKLRPHAVDLNAGIISISAEVSKVREPRQVTIQPNLAAWLRAYPLEKYPIIVGNFKKRRERFAKKFKLSHDVMRHSFISMFVAKFRSIGEAAIQAGNSEGIIRRHYLDLKSAEEAEDYWSILPQRAIPEATPLGVLSVPTFLGARHAKSAA
jgi:integrase